ncbi:MAG TPA: hypothetical protein PKB14_02415 [Rubrivivax sp.]|nr:hypothetical protein [Rubrivivax sp.]
MGSVLRTVLVWIMVLAMPAQGMAASTMLFCGPSHERMMPGVGADHHEAAVSAAHDHAATPHVADAADLDHAPSTGEAGLDDDGKFTDLGQFKCSACASCCSMLALPAGFAQLDEPGLADARPTAPVAAVQSHHAEGLERPPRATLA